MFTEFARIETFAGRKIGNVVFKDNLWNTMFYGKMGETVEHSPSASIQSLLGRVEGGNEKRVARAVECSEGGRRKLRLRRWIMVPRSSQR